MVVVTGNKEVKIPVTEPGILSQVFKPAMPIVVLTVFSSVPKAPGMQQVDCRPHFLASYETLDHQGQLAGAGRMGSLQTQFL